MSCAKLPVQATEPPRITREQLRAAYRRLAETDLVRAVGTVVRWGLEELRAGRDGAPGQKPEAPHGADVGPA